MKIKLVINDIEEEDSNVISLDSSSTISSWLIDYYFINIYSNRIKISNKSIQPNNIIGLHDMFIMYEVVQSTSSSSIEFFELCKKKLNQVENDLILEKYNNYLNRCGLKDLIDLFHECKLGTFIKIISFTWKNIQNEIDRLFWDYLLELSKECFVYDETEQIETRETKQNLVKLMDKEKRHVEQTISKNYIKHTLCTYLSLLLDTRNEHALIHCLITPARTSIERRTIVELRRLSKLSKNECLTIYQILLSFLRRKELILTRLSSSHPDSTTNDDESFVILDKYYNGIKEFFDFIEQLQMTIEENEHSKIESIITFRKLMGLISKQLRKDISFNRCDLIMKDIIEEFCQCFQTTLPIMDCTSPIRSASFGGSLTGRRFLRSVAYLCAKQTIDLPILLTNNDHYDSPSTGLRKATSSRLLRSPLTPIPIVIEQIKEIPIEEKSIDIPVESVFIWQKKTKNTEDKQLEEDLLPSEKKRYRRRKSHRCLDLSTIHETSFDSNSITNPSTDSNDKISSQSLSSNTTRQPLGEIHIDSFNNEERTENESNHSQKSALLPLINDNDKENLPITIKKRLITSTNIEPARKKQKKTNVKPLVTGQKMITNFFHK